VAAIQFCWLSSHLRNPVAPLDRDRVAIGAAPCLLPFMFQAGFGLETISNPVYWFWYMAAGNLLMIKNKRFPPYPYASNDAVFATVLTGANTPDRAYRRLACGFALAANTPVRYRGLYCLGGRSRSVRFNSPVFIP